MPKTKATEETIGTKTTTKSLGCVGERRGSVHEKANTEKKETTHGAIG